ncbi:MAG: LptE family protein [Flavobacteriales bacterium]|nr:LptE family protein [Flavobacteriales bacterium]
MKQVLHKLWCAAVIAVLLVGGGCGVYTPYGAQTAGARTFSVDYFTPVAPLAGPEVGQQFTEALKDLIQRQSTLQWVAEGGDIQYSGRIVGYDVSTSAVAGGQEVASQNRLTMQVQVQYVHIVEADLGFERTFSRFADFPATSDLFDVESELVEEINEQLTQEVFNASLGNW